MIVYAVSVRTSGGAIVAVDHGTKPPTPVAVERLPGDLGRVAEGSRCASSSVTNPACTGTARRAVTGAS